MHCTVYPESRLFIGSKMVKVKKLLSNTGRFVNCYGLRVGCLSLNPANMSHNRMFVVQQTWYC